RLDAFLELIGGRGGALLFGLCGLRFALRSRWRRTFSPADLHFRLVARQVFTAGEGLQGLPGRWCQEVHDIGSRAHAPPVLLPNRFNAGAEKLDRLLDRRMKL